MDPAPGAVYVPRTYQDRIFKDLPFFSDAFRALEDNPVADSVHEQISSVFQRHGMHRTVGLTVLHRHFDLEAGEKLVEYNAVTAPWRIPDSLKVLRGKVFPKSWVFNGEGGELYPYEFGYDPDVEGGGGGFSGFSVAFVQEVREVLARNALVRTYGLCLVSSAVWDPGAPRMLEFTAGRTSVVVPLSGGLDGVEMRSIVEATWVFPCVSSMAGVEGGGAPARLKICALECYGHKDPK